MALCKGCRWMAERLADRIVALEKQRALSMGVPVPEEYNKDFNSGLVPAAERIKFNIGRYASIINNHAQVHRDISQAFMNSDESLPEFSSFIRGKTNEMRTPSIMQYMQPEKEKLIEFEPLDSRARIPQKDLQKLKDASERANIDPESDYLDYVKVKAYTNIYERLAKKYRFTPTKVVVAKSDGAVLGKTVRQKHTVVLA